MMNKRIKEIWHSPRDINEAEVYILLSMFMALWMWMII